MFNEVQCCVWKQTRISEIKISMTPPSEGNKQSILIISNYSIFESTPFTESRAKMMLTFTSVIRCPKLVRGMRVLTGDVGMTEHYWLTLFEKNPDISIICYVQKCLFIVSKQTRGVTYTTCFMSAMCSGLLLRHQIWTNHKIFYLRLTNRWLAWWVVVS